MYEMLNGTTDLDDDDDDEEIINSSKYKEWFKNYIEIKVEELEDLFYDLELTIYRKISVSNDWFDNLKEYDNLGIYWSYEQDAAETHWGL